MTHHLVKFTRYWSEDDVYVLGSASPFASAGPRQAIPFPAQLAEWWDQVRAEFAEQGVDLPARFLRAEMLPNEHDCIVSFFARVASPSGGKMGLNLDLLSAQENGAAGGVEILGEVR